MIINLIINFLLKQMKNTREGFIDSKQHLVRHDALNDDAINN
jgi:hypothetical protein